VGLPTYVSLTRQNHRHSSTETFMHQHSSDLPNFHNFAQNQINNFSLHHLRSEHSIKHHVSRLKSRFQNFHRFLTLSAWRIILLFYFTLLKSLTPSM